MANYEVWYTEIRYRDQTRTWMTSSDRKSTPFEESSDEKAREIAKALMNAPSDDPLVDRRIPIKLVKVIEIM